MNRARAGLGPAGFHPHAFAPPARGCALRLPARLRRCAALQGPCPPSADPLCSQSASTGRVQPDPSTLCLARYKGLSRHILVAARLRYSTVPLHLTRRRVFGAYRDRPTPTGRPHQGGACAPGEKRHRPLRGRLKSVYFPLATLGFMAARESSTVTTNPSCINVVAQFDIASVVVGELGRVTGNAQRLRLMGVVAGMTQASVDAQVQITSLPPHVTALQAHRALAQPAVARRITAQGGAGRPGPRRYPVGRGGIRSWRSVSIGWEFGYSPKAARTAAHTASAS